MQVAKLLTALRNSELEKVVTVPHIYIVWWHCAHFERYEAQDIVIFFSFTTRSRLQTFDNVESHEQIPWPVVGIIAVFSWNIEEHHEMYQFRKSARSVLGPEASGTLSQPPKTILFFVLVFSRKNIELQLISWLHSRRYAVVCFIFEIYRVHKQVMWKSCRSFCHHLLYPTLKNFLKDLVTAFTSLKRQI